MIKKVIPVLTACSLLYIHAAQAESRTITPTPIDSLADEAVDDRINSRLDLIGDSINFVHLNDDLVSSPMLELVPTTVEGRLAYVQKEVPLNYNEQVQSYIDVYSTDRYKRYLSRMMGLGQYYFPIYERIFAEAGVPEEIKYLSIVESALNPHAVSRVGATGLWQFMFSTARMYGLTIDSYVDERKDPIAASHAAAAHLLDAYDQFGDWLMAIAAYNCGTGNVLRAIRRSGIDNPDYWAISPYLPRETRNYVPAFIAMTYMLEYHEENGIAAAETEVLPDTETVWVQRTVPFAGVAQALNIGEDVIATLNPAYKRGMVNGSTETPKRLILPEVKPLAYPALYAVLNNAPVPNQLQVVNASNTAGKAVTVTTHRVQKGETLEKIAKKYHITVQDLRAWNNLQQHLIVPGQQLKLSSGQQHQQNNTAAAAPTYLTYRVKKGDTLSGIAQKYRGATVSSIRTANALRGNTIRPGMTLKITVK
ncbi:LysM peptidoglycan-binding domain-containing protein [Parapedobacter lycopersici]|uniref:lytic transglycosylase domain-containing protein n=1 Tax=Parapedobacter lycopersici TaxID=1864939 RepID=UPI00333E372C